MIKSSLGVVVFYNPTDEVVSMKKELSEMSLEELWELFPIILKKHNPNYKEWYEIEERQLFSCIKNQDIKRINHIGSSAVEGLIAKPTVDILLEVDNNCDITRLIEILKMNSWILMSSEHEPDLKLVFNKGYTPDGFAEKVYHLHVRYLGDWNELYFRDYLLDHADVAVQYGNLKLSLWKEYEHNRDGYTEAKSDFIMRYTEKAKFEYAGRYITSKMSIPVITKTQ
ncbi:MAG: GrpB family protein [Anaerocolumna sp.]